MGIQIENQPQWCSESKIFFNYFCPYFNDKTFEKQYQKGVETLHLNLSKNENDILDFLIKNPKTIQIIDCGLAIFKKQSNLRKRFVLAAAIAEATTHSTDFYFNNENKKLPFLKFLYVGIKATIVMFMAFILFKIKAWK